MRTKPTQSIEIVRKNARWVLNKCCGGSPPGRIRFGTGCHGEPKLALSNSYLGESTQGLLGGCNVRAAELDRVDNQWRQLM